MIQIVDYATRSSCVEALEILQRRFREIEAAVPPAKWVPWETGYNWRFTEQLAEQVLLQKLARQISGAQAIDLLLLAGRLQEVGVLYRTLDEIEEDILFLALGIRTHNWTSNHDKYVKYFWSEDDADKQAPVQRKNIRAFVNRAVGQAEPSGADAIGRTIHKLYSDYIHARSAPIMAMVKGPPPRFDLAAIHNEEARFPYVEQNPMYFYRCLVSTCAIANVVLSDSDRISVFEELRAFEKKHCELLFGPHRSFA